MSSKIRHDLRVLVWFIELYCSRLHKDASRREASLHSYDLVKIAGHTPKLCEPCRKLLAHSFVKRAACPFDPKPACRYCPQHCYHPSYREQMRKVMRYSGARAILWSPVLYLRHAIETWRRGRNDRGRSEN